MIRFVTLLAVLLAAAPATATDCYQVQQVQRSVEYAVVQKSAPQVLYLVGAPYRAQVLVESARMGQSSDHEDAELLKKFRLFLEAEKSIAESRSAPVNSVLVQKCAKCHSAQNSAGGIVLDGSSPLTAEQKSKVMRSILSGEMPKDLEPLTDQERGEVAKLLFLGDW